MGTELTSVKKHWFKKIKDTNKAFKKDEIVKKLSNSKDVLDVGCVGQDIDYANPNWIHTQVKYVAKSLIGVDINREGLEDIKSMGYEAYHYDELDSDKKFDIILMLDVIEHVNNPVQFINDYKKFLQEDGKIIVTTPNSNRAINFINIFFRNEYSLNYEHTFWFCPKTFLEVINRVDELEVSEFYWLEDYQKDKTLNWKGKIIYFLEKIFIKKSSNFYPNFMFILELKK